MKFDTPTHSSDENFSDMMLKVQECSMRTDGFSYDSLDAVTLVADEFDVDGDVDHSAVGRTNPK